MIIHKESMKKKKASGNAGGTALKKDLKKKTTGSRSTKKEEKLKKQLEETQNEIHQLNDRLLRTAAELENFRKRKERESIQLIQSANEKLILSVLPVVDDFERSLKVSNDLDAEDFRKGVELIYQKLVSILENQGVRPMKSEGELFDVDKHDALLQVEKEGLEPGYVVEEHERGYYREEKVIRHAKVVVSK